MRKSKLRWEDPEYKLRVSESMIKEKSTPEAKKRISLSSQKMWDSKTPEERIKFKEKMQIITSDENYKKNMSNILKEVWLRDDMQEKKRNRKPRGSDGSKMKEKWADPIWKAAVLEVRNIKRQRKTDETNKD